MSELTAAQRQALQRRLDEREQELRAEVRSAKQAPAEWPSAQGPNVQDLVEGSEERFRHGIEHAELQRDQQELAAIAAARERITAGTYGRCIDCGRPIPLARLQVQPSALRCIDCQARWEKSHPSAPAFSV